MGVNCQLVKDSKGNIINVEAPNGNDSMLYSDLKQVTGNENDAVTLWSYSYTEDFENIENTSPRDQNGEHIYSTVLRHVENINDENSDFTEKDAVEFVDSFVGTPLVDINHAYSALKRGFYTDGLFNINKDFLVKSRLYTESEIDNIMQKPELQDSIRNGISKIKSFLLSGKNTAQIDGLISSNNTYVLNTDEVSSYGKVLKMDEASFDKKYGKDFIGVETQDQLIEKILNTGDQNLIQKATDDSYFLYELFSKYSGLQNIQNLKEKDGELVSVYDNDTEDLFLSTLKTRIPNTGIEVNYEFLTNIEDKAWNNNEKEVKAVLDTIADESSKIGINLYNLSETYNHKSQLEILAFLEDTAGFTSLLYNKIATKLNIAEYAGVYDNFFGIEKTIKETAVPKSELSLFAIDTLLSENEMYEKHGMIKVSDGVYQRVEKVGNPIEDLFGLDFSNRMEEKGAEDYISISEINKIPKGGTFNDVYAVDYYNTTKDNIRDSGIKEPLILRYYVKENALRLTDGHHRLKIANELGIKNIPIRINVVWMGSIKDSSNSDIENQPIYHPPIALDTDKYTKRNYAPSNVNMEELGFVNDAKIEDNLLNDIAYYPIAYNTNNEFSDVKFKKADEADLQKSVERYIKKVASEYDLNEDILALKIAFRHPLKPQQKEVNIEEEVSNYEDFDGNPAYLKREFMHDFQMEKAKQQSKNSMLYNNVLQYLEVKDGKLVLNTDNDFILNKINLLLPNKGVYKNIRNYAKLSKNSLLHSTIKSTDNGIIDVSKTTNGLRRYYINNPSALSNYKGEFKTIDSQHIEIDSKEDAFIRIKTNVYEKVGEAVDGITSYSKILGQIETDYNNINGDVNITDVKHKNILKNISPSSSAVSQTNLYTKSELSDMEEEMDRC